MAARSRLVGVLGAALGLVLAACQPGTPVTDFGTAGSVELPWANVGGLVSPILASGSDGQIVVNSTTGGALWEVDPATGAAVDPGTGPGARDWFGSTPHVVDIHPTPDGGAFLYGAGAGSYKVAKVGPTGALDTTYAGGGLMNARPGASFLDADGYPRVVSSTSFDGFNYGMSIHTPTGVSGAGPFDLPTDDLEPFPAGAIDPQTFLTVADVVETVNGPVVLGRVTQAWMDETGLGLNLDSNIVLFRLQADGSLDTSFAGDGMLTVDTGLDGAGDAAPGLGFDDQPARASAMADGGIVLVSNLRPVGGTTEYFVRGVVVLVTADGRLDSAFGGDGVRAARTPDGAYMSVSTVLRTGDFGRVLVAGLVEGGTFQGAVTRYDSSTGAFDAAFGQAGLLSITSCLPRSLLLRNGETEGFVGCVRPASGGNPPIAQVRKFYARTYA